MILSDHEFDMLWDTRYQWKGKGWKEQVDDDRFTAHDGEPVNLEYKSAYFISHPASFILAKHYLDQRNLRYQALSDNNLGGYVILHSSID